MEEARRREKARIYLDKVLKEGFLPNVEGCSKYACIKSGYVYLKYKKLKNGKNPEYSFRQRKNLNSKLLELGVLTPKILLANEEKHGDIIEVQEEAPGRVLYYRHDKNAIKFALKNKYKSLQDNTKVEDLPEKAKKSVGYFVSDYAIAMQKQLKDAPISQYKKFLEDYKTISRQGVTIDFHGENIMYDADRGFTFIDIDENVDLGRKYCNDAELLSEIIMLISGFNGGGKFKKLIDDDKLEVIEANNFRILGNILMALNLTDYNIELKFQKRIFEDIASASGVSPVDVFNAIKSKKFPEIDNEHERTHVAKQCRRKLNTI